MHLLSRRLPFDNVCSVFIMQCYAVCWLYFEIRNSQMILHSRIHSTNWHNWIFFRLLHWNSHGGEDLIVTPFAQILASLRSVRNNFLSLTNCSTSKYEIRAEHSTIYICNSGIKYLFLLTKQCSIFAKTDRRDQLLHHWLSQSFPVMRRMCVWLWIQWRSWIGAWTNWKLFRHIAASQTWHRWRYC